MAAVERGADPKGYHISTRTPRKFGGQTVHDYVKTAQTSIFKDKELIVSNARVHLPAENPKYPETKHTMKKLVHNITSFSVTDRPGTESYDPVLLGGKSLVDHYPYASITNKEVLVNPLSGPST